MQCSKCPDTALDCERNIIKMKNGYWRKDDTSEEIIECVNNKKSCIPEDNDNKLGC